MHLPRALTLYDSMDGAVTYMYYVGAATMFDPLDGFSIHGACRRGPTAQGEIASARRAGYLRISSDEVRAKLRRALGVSPSSRESEASLSMWDSSTFPLEEDGFGSGVLDGGDPFSRPGTTASAPPMAGDLGGGTGSSSSSGSSNVLPRSPVGSVGGGGGGGGGGDFSRPATTSSWDPHDPTHGHRRIQQMPASMNLPLSPLLKHIQRAQTADDAGRRGLAAHLNSRMHRRQVMLAHGAGTTYTTKHQEAHDPSCRCFDCVRQRLRRQSSGAEELRQERIRHEQDDMILQIKMAIKHHRSIYGKQITTVQELFEVTDKDNSGDIDLDEFARVLRRLGVTATDAQFQSFFDRADKDNNGSIDLEELQDVISTHVHNPLVHNKGRTVGTIHSHVVKSLDELGIQKQWKQNELGR